MLAEFSVWTVAIAIVLLMINIVYKAISYKKKIDVVPGPREFPIVGNLSFMLCQPDILFKLMREYNIKYKNMWSIWIGYVGTIFITNQGDMEQILSSPKHIKKSEIYTAIIPWLKEGLLTSNGDKWQTRRKILTPAFHFNILQQFLPIFIEHSDNLVQKLKVECDKDSTNVVPYITETTLHAICETAMGTRLDSKTKSQNEYVNAIYRIGDMVVYRLRRPWLFNDYLYNLLPIGRKQNKTIKALHDFSTGVIKERQDNFHESKLTENNNQASYKGKKRLAMLDLLLSARAEGADIDDEGIREEVDTFMFEGHDTTSMCICFTIMLLACHKEAQEKILQEIDEIIGADNWPPTYHNLQELQYLERCLKESLRLYPSVPLISREINEDITTTDGHVIPAGCPVQLQIFDLHRDPENFPDPEKFDPDRFLPEATRTRHPYAYVPFSAGPRNCIGQRFALLELKTMISAILRSYVLEPIDTPDTITMISDLVLRTKDGIRVKFRPRVV